MRASVLRNKRSHEKRRVAKRVKKRKLKLLASQAGDR
jgi:hypothetical protein